MSAYFFVALIIGCAAIGAVLWRFFSKQKRSTVIIVVGASSAGKTSLTRALINTLYPDKLFITTGIDQTFFALGSATNLIIRKHWVDGEVNFIYTTDSSGRPIVDLSMGALGDKIQRINFDFAVAAADRGLNVVVDEVLLNDLTFEYVLDAFKKHNVYIVSMSASLEVREARERARINRFVGHTRSQEERAYCYKGHDIREEKLYDLSFDSEVDGTNDCVQKIVSYIERHRPAAIDRLLEVKPTKNVALTPNYQEACLVAAKPFKKEEDPVAILLIGASSSGKTTLSQGLINAFYPNKIFLSVGIDDIFRALGDDTVPLRRDYWVDGEINYLKGVDEEGKPTIAVSLGALGEDLMHLAYDRSTAYLNAGFNLVIDDVLLSDRVFDHALKVLKTYRVYLVGVHAPLGVRETREVARGNRPVGHTRTQEVIAYSYRGVNIVKDNLCDLVIDTSAETTQQSIDRIVEHITTHQPHALSGIRQRVITT